MSVINYNIFKRIKIEKIFITVSVLLVGISKLNTKSVRDPLQNQGGSY